MFQPEAPPTPTPDNTTTATTPPPTTTATPPPTATATPTTNNSDNNNNNNSNDGKEIFRSFVDDTTPLLTPVRSISSRSVGITRRSMQQSDFLPEAVSSTEFEISSEIIPAEYHREIANLSISSAHKRNIDSTGPFGTFMHLIKGNIGLGLISIPHAMRDSGYALGPVALLAMGIIAIHCMTLMVSCGQYLCRELQLSALTYAEVAELSFGYKFKRRRIGIFAKIAVNSMLILTQLGFCCTYFGFMAQSLNNVLVSARWMTFDIKLLILMILPFVILGSYIRNLKTLGPLSSVANLCFLYGIGVCIFYSIYQIIVTGGLGEDVVVVYTGDVLRYPLFFANIIFTFEGIGVVLPLENKISKPNLFPFILWSGMILVTVIYTILGLIGYLALGSALLSAISFNLPTNITAPWMVIYPLANLVLAIGIYVSYFIQFYVPMEILEPFIFRLLPGRKYIRLASQIVFRTVIVTFTAFVAIAVPNLSDLIELIGASSSSFLALIFPPLLEIATFYKCKRYHLPFHIWIIKDIAIIALGVVGAILGTGTSILQIVRDYGKSD